MPWRWLKRRRLTVSLVVFFAVWQVAQLYVLSTFGTETAIWWFYFDGALSPGYLLASVSHNMADLGHLKRNVVLLLIVGGAAEPYLKESKHVALLLGLSFTSIGIANLVSILVRTQWVLAGASGGVFGLWAFIGVKNRSLVLSGSEQSGNDRSRNNLQRRAYPLVRAYLRCIHNWYTECESPRWHSSRVRHRSRGVPTSSGNSH